MAPTAAQEVGKTIRIALKDWESTARLCLILAYVSLPLLAYLALRKLPMIMW